MSPLILFLFFCSLAHSSFLWKVEISSIQGVCTVLVSSSPGRNKGRARLLLFCMICVGLFSALRSGTVFLLPIELPRCPVCASVHGGFLINVLDWFTVLHSKKTTPHFIPKRLHSTEHSVSGDLWSWREEFENSKMWECEILKGI